MKTKKQKNQSSNINLLQRITSIVIAAALTLPVTAVAETINGAGATFPYPIYAKWAYAYNQATGIKLNYQSIGSGGGINQIINQTVDFGASDAPLEPEKLAKEKLFQFPMVIGGVVPVVNLPGIGPGDLKLPSDVLVDIFLGTIRTWDDARIAAVNPGRNLPAKKITVVHRADGSGTSWIFTNYLDKVSAAWHHQVGFGKAVQWPTGVGGKGNEGVASYVRRIAGSIGYVEYAYVVQNHMTWPLLQNRAGAFVTPTSSAFQAAAANADWAKAPGYYLVLTDQPGVASWPISGASFILMHKRQDNPEAGRRVLEFFDWCYKNGGQMADELNYVPMPGSVVKLVQTAWVGTFTPGIWPASK